MNNPMEKIAAAGSFMNTLQKTLANPIVRTGITTGVAIAGSVLGPKLQANAHRKAVLKISKSEMAKVETQIPQFAQRFKSQHPEWEYDAIVRALKILKENNPMLFSRPYTLESYVGSIIDYGGVSVSALKQIQDTRKAFDPYSYSAQYKYEAPSMANLVQNVSDIWLPGGVK